jgi:hypothetical protein
MRFQPSLFQGVDEPVPTATGFHGHGSSGRKCLQVLLQILFLAVMIDTHRRAGLSLLIVTNTEYR